MKYIVCFLLYCCSAFATESTTVNLNIKSPILKLYLPANPTTGFRWQINSYDHTLFALVKSFYQQTKPARIGSSGEMIFIFASLPKPTHPDYTIINLEYKRPWTNEGSVLKKIKVKFVS